MVWKIPGFPIEMLPFFGYFGRQSGIGVFADESMELLYTGGDLSIAQIDAATTGSV